MLASDNTSLNPAKIFLSVKLFENLVNEKRSGIAHLKLFPTSFSLISCFKLTKRMFINYLMMRSTFYGGSELSTNCNTTRAHLDLDPKTKRFLVGWTEIYFIRDYYLHRNLSLKSTFDRCYDLYELSTYLPSSASFSFIFGLFKQTLQTLLRISVKKCPSSIWCQDSNSQPSDYESPLLTTRPGLPITLPRWRSRPNGSGMYVSNWTWITHRLLIRLYFASMHVTCIEWTLVQSNQKEQKTNCILFEWKEHETHLIFGGCWLRAM